MTITLNPCAPNQEYVFIGDLTENNKPAYLSDHIVKYDLREIGRYLKNRCFIFFWVREEGWIMQRINTSTNSCEDQINVCNTMKFTLPKWILNLFKK